MAIADLSTLFLPVPPVAGFNSSLFISFRRMLGLDCNIFELALVVVFFSQVAAFSGGVFRLWPTTGGVGISLVSLTSGLAGVNAFLKIMFVLCFQD